MSKKRSTTTAQTLTPGAQSHVNAMRNLGQGAIGDVLNAEGSFFVGPETRSPAALMAPFMNPYQSQVIDSLRGEFDLLRDQARTGVSQAATAAGGGGAAGGAINRGSRAGIAEGVRLGEIDRAQGGQVAGLLSDNFWRAMSGGLDFAAQNRALEQQRLQEPIFRRQQALQLMNMGLGPTPLTQTTTEKGSTLGAIGGLGMTALGMLTGGAPQAGASAISTLSGMGPGHPTLSRPDVSQSDQMAEDWYRNFQAGA